MDSASRTAHDKRLARNRLARTTARKSAIAAILLWSTSSSAQVAPRLDESKSAALLLSAGRLGISFFDLAQKSQVPARVTLTLDEPNTTKLRNDFELLGKGYRARMERGAAEGAFMRAHGAAVIDAATVVGAASGVGAIPTVLARAGAGWLNEKLASGIQQAGEDRARNYIGTQLDRWSAAQHAEFQSLMSQGRRQEAADLFDSNTGLLTGLRAGMGDDQAGRVISEGYLFETLRTGTYDALRQSANASADVAAVRKDFTEFSKGMTEFAARTETRLTGIETELSGINGQLAGVQRDVQSLIDGQAATTAQVSAIQDVLFGQAPTGQRIAMIKGGMVPNLTGDARDKVMAALVLEQRKEQVLASASRLVSATRDVATIMTNFGIDDPRIGQAVQLATVGQAALGGVMSGNYLGAVAAVSSLFGKSGPDPDAQRFEAIMKQLQVINQKLDRIIDLQLKTLEAVAQLSAQMADLDTRLNQRLDRVEFELGVLSSGVRSLLWKDYLTCGTAWVYRDDSQGLLASFDVDALRFTDAASAFDFSQRNGLSAGQCAAKLRDLFASVRLQKVFGNLLSLSFAASADPLLYAPTPGDPGRVWAKPELADYLEKVYRPTASITLMRWNARAGALPGLFASLSAPSGGVAELDRRWAELDAAAASDRPSFACKRDRTLLGDRLRYFLCDSFNATGAAVERQAAERAEAFIRDPVVREQMLYVGQWVALVTRHEDFRRPDGTYAASIEQLPVRPNGRAFLADFVSLLDIAVAQQAMVYGDVTARNIYDLAWDATANQPRPAVPIATITEANAVEQSAVRVLANTNNPWLRHNVLMIALDRALLPSAGPAAGAWMPYSVALDGMTAHPWGANAAADAMKLANTRQFLAGLFRLPANASVETEVVDGLRRYQLSWDGRRFELPSAAAFRERELRYPAAVTELIQQRKAFAEKLADYDLLAAMPEDQRLRTMTVLWRGLQHGGKAQ